MATKIVRIGSGPPGPRRRWWHRPLHTACQAALSGLLLMLLLALVAFSDVL